MTTRSIKEEINMFLDSDSNTIEIKKLLKCGGNVDCAVAFIGGNSSALLPDLPQNSRIICNLDSSATNPYAVKQLIDKGFEVRSCNFLHAKVYIGKDKAIVSSANLSSNGLSLSEDEKGWLEAGYLVTDKAEISKINEWFDYIFTSDNISKEIKDDDLERAIKRWSEKIIDRPSNINNKNNISIINVLKSNPKELCERNIFVVINTEEMCKNAQKQLNKSRGVEGDLLDAYEDWEEIPKNAYILDFFVENIKSDEAKVVFRGVFSTDKNVMSKNFINDKGKKSKLYFCWRRDKVLELYSIDAGDVDFLKDKIRSYIKNKGKSHDYDEPIDILEIAGIKLDKATI